MPGSHQKPSALIVRIAGVISAVGAAGAVIWAAYGHFTTDAEAAQHHEKLQKELRDYQAQQFYADKADRLDRFQREIDRVDYQLISEDLSERQREYLKNKRRDIERKMACVERDEC